jgi:hypothetical protein
MYKVHGRLGFSKLGKIEDDPKCRRLNLKIREFVPVLDCVRNGRRGGQWRGWHSRSRSTQRRLAARDLSRTYS